MEKFTGIVDKVIFRNDENMYTVLNLVLDDGEICCVGNMPDINEGTKVEVTGEFIVHQTYGSQLKVSTISEKVPHTEEEIINYLASGIISGIGPKIAERIVTRFGEDTLDIFENDPERLSEIKGISLKKAREIGLQYEEKQGEKNALMFLQPMGISLNLGLKLYKKYGSRLQNVILENPYVLAEDIRGIGFKMADEIAKKIGIPQDSDFRIKSGLLYVLRRAVDGGNMYLPKGYLYNLSSNLLEIDRAYFDKYLADLIIERKVVVLDIENNGDEENIAVYHYNLYEIERNTAYLLDKLNKDIKNKDKGEILSTIEQVESHLGSELDEIQKSVIEQASISGLMVITGGPGTGKTTTINALIKYYEKIGLNIVLASPTGRAAKRMSEASGYPASTIHRLLELNSEPSDNLKGSNFGRNSENPIEADVIIIDEMSMVDIYLFYYLLCAIKHGTRLVLVGDSNQLPSVGPGNVLLDIINSNCVKTICLTKIFRQAQESDIVVNAHRVYKGEPIKIKKDSGDFFFLERTEADKVISVILTLMQEKLPKYVNAGWREIAILTPMKKGNLGVERLNTILQRYLNPESIDKPEALVNNRLFRTGDKVMQIKNDYQQEWTASGATGIAIEKGEGVFNGDTGIIIEINSSEKYLVVNFDDGKISKYQFSQLDSLELAYSMTIHKSQGSEYPAVIIPILSGPLGFLNRNLLYTAITRAKKCVTIVGSIDTVNRMIKNKESQKRYTSLCRFIQEMRNFEL